MNNLAYVIDNITNPEFPEYFSEDDRKDILTALSCGKQMVRAYDGDFKAPWLLNNFADTKWITTNRGREEKVGGVWKNANCINWKMLLPNGFHLTDPKYSKLLNLNKRIAFFIRSGDYGSMPAIKSWSNVVQSLILITRWTVLNEKNFRPEKYGYSLFDQNTVDSLLHSIAEGGWTSALQLQQRLLSCFYLNSFGTTCPQHIFDSIYNIPLNFKDKIIDWLLINDFYGKIEQGTYKGKAYLKRERLASLINEQAESLSGSPKLNAFIRQFETDFQFTPLLVYMRLNTEKPDHKIKTIQEIISEGSTDNILFRTSSDLRTIFLYHRHIPDLLPEPSLISMQKAVNNTLHSTRASGCTPFIPVNVGLSYLNAAMRLVHVYGEAVVDYYLAVIAKRPDNISWYSRSSITLELMDDICNELSSQFMVHIDGISHPIVEALGINRFQILRSEINYDLLRERPTLDEALRVIIGACITCIGLMKPSRESELTHLKRDCLRHNGEGYFLNFALGKSNTGELYQNEDRPIPVITAKAIQILQKLGETMATQFNDKRKIATNLFYLPMKFGFGALGASSTLLNKHLNVFCDYVGMPVDNMGRRWYIRIHEMRKWFLFLLFWSGRFDVLDAARWIAGHTHAEHIYSYIETEFPGEELPNLEAEYAVERLRALESSGGNKDQTESGLDELYIAVLKHFKVQSLSMVQDYEWIDYVSVLRKTDGFFLEPHSVHANNGKEIVGINVSFVLREARK